MSKLIIGKERRYQEVQSQKWKSQRLSEPSEDTQCVTQLCKRDWKQMTVWLPKKLMVLFKSAGPDISSLISAGCLWPLRERSFSSDPEVSLAKPPFQDSGSAPLPWLYQKLHQPAREVSSTWSDSRTFWFLLQKEAFFFSIQAENQQVSLFLTSKFYEVT